MLELGKWQKLTVVKKVDFGIYLAHPEEKEEKVLLPAKQAPEDVQLEDMLDVFLYKDSQDRLIATTRQPLIEIGWPAVLKVSQVGKIGAFLDWGLEKELLLPFREQTKRVQEGEQVLVALYVDKSERLCATMNVYEQLRTDAPYEPGDEVTGVIYETSQEFGAFVAVDNIYSALIPRQEYHGEHAIGDKVQARVKSVREDGKLNLTIRRKAYLQMEDDARTVLTLLDSCEGVLPFNDKASPQVIERELHMSKNAFKRAVGRLLKLGMIEITDVSIRRRP